MELFETLAKQRIIHIKKKIMQIQRDTIAKQDCCAVDQAYDAVDTKGGDKADDAQCHELKTCKEVLNALRGPTEYAQGILQWLDPLSCNGVSTEPAT